MTITADSALYTADSDCITADGFNGCYQSGAFNYGEGGYSTYGKTGKKRELESRYEIQMREDEEVLVIIMAINEYYH